MIVYGCSLSPVMRGTLVFIAQKGPTTGRKPLPPHLNAKD